MAEASLPPSPVTGRSLVEVVDRISVSQIIERYRVDWKMDVSRYFHALNDVLVLKCSDTGYRFYFPETVAGESEFYEELRKAYHRAPNFDGQAENWYRTWGHDYEFAYKRIAPGELVLDVGCGEGQFLRRIREKADAFGLEQNRLAHATCVDQGLRVVNTSLQAFAAENEERFDTVCMFQVLEHVYDVRSFLESAAKLTKRSGKVIIGVPNNEPYFKRFDRYNAANLPPHHIGLWDQPSLEKAAKLFGLQMVEHEYNEMMRRWVVDAYYRARFWANIETDYHQHSLIEKLKMLLLAPFSVPLSFRDHVHSGIRGSFVVALFARG